MYLDIIVMTATCVYRYIKKKSNKIIGIASVALKYIIFLFHIIAHSTSQGVVPCPWSEVALKS